MFDTGSNWLGAQATVDDNICVVSSYSSVEGCPIERIFSSQVCI